MAGRSGPTNLTDNGSTTAVMWHGGEIQVCATGTFGTGTVVLEYSYDEGTTWATVGSGSLTANGTFVEKVAPGPVRATLSGASGPDINVELMRYSENIAGFTTL